MVVGLAAASFASGFISHRYRAPAGSHRGPIWFTARNAPPREPGPEEVLAVPYLQGYRPPREPARATLHDRQRAYEGLNLWVSGHAPEAFLTDMTGREVHRWRYDFERAWPGRRVAPEDRLQDRFWRHAQLLDNGDLLVIFERLGLLRLDRASRLVWAFSGGVHHDLAVSGGRIFALTRRPAGSGRIEDFITVLDERGAVQREVSLLEAFRRSEYRPLLDRMPQTGDLFHTNGLDLLGAPVAGRPPLFGEGRVLISVLTLNTVALVDLDAERVVWAISDMWRHQHDPRLLESGRLLVFDNLWDAARRASRVVEVDPSTQQIAWQYHAGPGQEFFSEVCGSSQRLPNGNTLIVETTAGRAFEVTPEGEMVWEFWNPFRSGDRGELIAALYGMTRLSTETATAAGLLPAALLPGR
jgi:hypothetical protein